MQLLLLLYFEEEKTGSKIELEIEGRPPPPLQKQHQRGYVNEEEDTKTVEHRKEERGASWVRNRARSKL